ncbi:SDR family NAD(P)-dependent oxidoreductase, partial [Nostoc sp. NIES-2111]
MRMNIGDQLPAMTTGEIGGGSSQVAEIELRQIADVVRRRWWIVGLCMAVGIACAIVYVMRATPLYSASATVLLDRNSDELSDQIVKAGQAGSEFAETAAVETQIEVLNSIEFLKRVVIRNKLENDPELNPPADAPSILARMVGWMTGLFSSSQPDQAADADAHDPALLAASNLQSMLLVARSVDRLQAEAASLPGAVAHAADLRDHAAAPTAVAEAMARFGRIDLLVNCAGATRRGDFLALDDEAWSDGYALKLFGAVRMARAAWP